MPVKHKVINCENEKKLPTLLEAKRLRFLKPLDFQPIKRHFMNC